MKKQQLTKLTLKRTTVANFKKIFGGGWQQGPTATATQGDCEDQTASCLCGDPGDGHFISKGGGCPSIDPNNGNQVPVCVR